MVPQPNYSDIIASNWKREQQFLAENASQSRHATRRGPERIPDRENVRLAYSHDADRIMHCVSYARYIDKTQVFFLLENDEITHRVLHVQLVSRIGRTIARCLGANEDLVEAIALGHDIGHAPFGHAGEEFLAKILFRKNAGTFVHNAQSVRVLDLIESGGLGLNLTLQVLDGILGHNGEIIQNRLTPEAHLDWAVLDKNCDKCFAIPKADREIRPSTTEGCIVRLADVISYIGRDVEDAITVDLIQREELPADAVAVLGCRNREIINALVMDVIDTSRGQSWVGFSERAYGALTKLKQFNYDKIYLAPKILEEKRKLERVFDDLFDAYLDDLGRCDEGMDIFRIFLSKMKDTYVGDTPRERIVSDFMAGMTDDFLVSQFSKRFVPRSLGYKLRQAKKEGQVQALME